MTIENRSRILIVDDREDLLQFCRRGLGEEFQFQHVSSGGEARTILEEGARIDAVLLDRDFSRSDPAGLLGPREDVTNEGLHVLRWLRARHPEIPVLMVTGYRDQQTAMEAADMGADFLAWQDLVEQPNILRARLSRALEMSGDRPEAILARFREMGLATESPSFRRTLIALHQAVEGDAPILLLGETGTGKDTLAFAAHALSGDSGRPYVSVNVAALNPGLIESELFGHARGGYRGAGQATLGKLRFADGGTLFLNEVGELPLEMQAKLLTALDQGEVVPVGDVHSHRTRFRLLCATSADLRAGVRSNRFRRDLYHRIAWHTIVIPPLRERREDIPSLIRTFLRSVGQGQDGGVIGIAREAVDYLCSLPWEGNVRELKAVLAAASAVARYVITLPDVHLIIRRYETVAVAGLEGDSESHPETGRHRSDYSREHDVVPSDGTAAHAELEACERNIFGNLSYRELTERYFHYLYRVSNGRLTDLARRADIAKTTAYEWRNRFGAQDPA